MTHRRRSEEHHRGRTRLPSGDGGTVSLLMILMALGLFLATGLVVDGGQKLRATQRARDAAGEAARTAVLSVQPAGTVRGRAPQVDAAAAVRAAQAYLTRAGVAGTATVAAGQVQVEATSTFTPSFLSLVGLGQQTVTGTAAARLARGVVAEQPS